MPIKFLNKSHFTSRRSLLYGLGSVAALSLGGAALSPWLHEKPLKTPNSDFKPHCLRLAWAMGETDSLFIIAQEKGFFNRYNLDIQMLPAIRNSTQVMDCLKTNQCDIALLSILDWLPNLLSGNLKAKLLVGVSGGNFRLLVSRYRRLERLADLSGLSIATRPTAEKEKLFFSILLRRKGLNPDQNIKWVTMEAEELLPALLSHQVNGIIGHDPLMWRLLTSANKDVYELAGSQSGSWSKRVNRILGVRQDYLDQNPDVTLPLALAIQDAAKWQAKHLKETSILLADHEKHMTSNQIYTMLNSQNQAITPFNNDLWEQVAQYIDEMKLLNRIPNTEKSSRTARQLCATITL